MVLLIEKVGLIVFVGSNDSANVAAKDGVG